MLTHTAFFLSILSISFLLFLRLFTYSCTQSTDWYGASAKQQRLTESDGLLWEIGQFKWIKRRIDDGNNIEHCINVNLVIPLILFHSLFNFFLLLPFIVCFVFTSPNIVSASIRSLLNNSTVLLPAICQSLFEFVASNEILCPDWTE